MTTLRLSRLHQRILVWLTSDHQRTKDFILSSHEELVQALGGYKGNISRRLQTWEKREWIVVGRSAGGKTQTLRLTSEGHHKASDIMKKLSLSMNSHRNNTLEAIQ
jgi:hypothetical protein